MFTFRRLVGRSRASFLLPRNSRRGLSQRSGLAAPAAAELNYVEKQIGKYLEKYGGWLQYSPDNEARRKTALDDRAVSSGPRARERRRP